MFLTVQESKATSRAGYIMGRLLTEEGPQPIERNWLPGERECRASEVTVLVEKLKRALHDHHKLCKPGTKCIHHSMNFDFSAPERATLLDCLAVAHILLCSQKTEENYDSLKHVRSVLYKLGAALVGAKR